MLLTRLMCVHPVAGQKENYGLTNTMSPTRGSDVVLQRARSIYKKWASKLLRGFILWQALLPNERKQPHTIKYASDQVGVPLQSGLAEATYHIQSHKGTRHKAQGTWHRSQRQAHNTKQKPAQAYMGKPPQGYQRPHPAPLYM